MEIRKKRILCLSAVLLFTLLFPTRAFAGYLDPGSGSFFIQLIIATIVGGLISVKLYWKNIKENISSLFKKHDK
jgi:hypothetical protein